MSDEVSVDVGLTAKIVSAHVGHNEVSAETLPSLILSVYHSLSTAGHIKPAPVAAPVPAVPVKKSVFPDYIVCLEDGKKLKMLRRHLQTSYGLTPDGYRAKWGLPNDYPMVAPTYSARRSTLAKTIGLGLKPEHKPAEEAEVTTEPAVRSMPSRRAKGSRG